MSPVPQGDGRVDQVARVGDAVVVEGQQAEAVVVQLRRILAVRRHAVFILSPINALLNASSNIRPHPLDTTFKDGTTKLP